MTAGGGGDTCAPPTSARAEERLLPAPRPAASSGARDVTRDGMASPPSSPSWRGLVCRSCGAGCRDAGEDPVPVGLLVEAPRDPEHRAVLTCGSATAGGPVGLARKRKARVRTLCTPVRPPVPWGHAACVPSPLHTLSFHRPAPQNRGGAPGTPGQWELPGWGSLTSCWGPGTNPLLLGGRCVPKAVSKSEVETSHPRATP